MAARSWGLLPVICVVKGEIVYLPESCVVSRVLCAVCWFPRAIIRSYMVMYVVRECITLRSECMRCSVACLLLLESTYAVKN